MYVACDLRVYYKLRTYRELGVAECWRSDFTGTDEEPLMGRRLQNGRYEFVPMQIPGVRGYSEVLGLDIGVERQGESLELRLWTGLCARFSPPDRVRGRL